jgi:hypothetical protein
VPCIIKSPNYCIHASYSISPHLFLAVIININVRNATYAFSSSPSQVHYRILSLIIRSIALEIDYFLEPAVFLQKLILRGADYHIPSRKYRLMEVINLDSSSNIHSLSRSILSIMKTMTKNDVCHMYIYSEDVFYLVWSYTIRFIIIQLLPVVCHQHSWWSHHCHKWKCTFSETFCISPNILSSHVNQYNNV